MLTSPGIKTWARKTVWFEIALLGNATAVGMPLSLHCGTADVTEVDFLDDCRHCFVEDSKVKKNKIVTVCFIT